MGPSERAARFMRAFQDSPKTAHPDHCPSMFQPVLLHFLLTALLMAALVAAATFCAPRLKMRRTAVFNLATLLALVAFIPACAGIRSEERRVGKEC